MQARDVGLSASQACGATPSILAVTIRLYMVADVDRTIGTEERQGFAIERDAAQA